MGPGAVHLSMSTISIGKYEFVCEPITWVKCNYMGIRFEFIMLITGCTEDMAKRLHKAHQAYGSTFIRFCEGMDGGEGIYGMACVCLYVHNRPPSFSSCLAVLSLHDRTGLQSGYKNRRRTSALCFSCRPTHHWFPIANHRPFDAASVFPRRGRWRGHPHFVTLSHNTYIPRFLFFEWNKK